MYKSQSEMMKDWLMAYRNEEKEIDEQLEKLRELRSRIMSIGAQELSAMPKSSSCEKDSLTEYLIRAEEIECILSDRMKRHEKDRETIADLAGHLGRVEERKIIRARYLFGMEWSEVMLMLYKGAEGFADRRESYRRKMYRAHEAALREMSKLWSAK